MAAHQHLRVGDTVTTAVPDPWGGPTLHHRTERVTRAGRFLIRTDHGYYTPTGRCLTLTQPLAFPRVVISKDPS